MNDITIEEKYRKAYINILPTPFTTKEIKIDYSDFEDIYTKNVAIDVVSKIKNSDDYTDYMPDCTLVHTDFNRIIITTKNVSLIKCLGTLCSLLIKDSNKVILRYDYFNDGIDEQEYKNIIKILINKKIIYPTNKSDIFVINHNLIYKGSIDLFHIAYHDLYIKEPDGILDLINDKVHLYDNLNYYE